VATPNATAASAYDSDTRQRVSPFAERHGGADSQNGSGGAGAAVEHGIDRLVDVVQGAVRALNLSLCASVCLLKGAG
jgi:hypothetical protein